MADRTTAPHADQVPPTPRHHITLHTHGDGSACLISDFGHTLGAGTQVEMIALGERILARRDARMARVHRQYGRRRGHA